MSTADEVVTLKARIEEYEKNETLLKDKLKEEHAQLVNFQKKLTQAGSHLKTLAQENAKLTASVAEEKKKSKEEIASLNEKFQESVKKTQEGHQREIKQLVDILESSTLDDTQQDTIPDVSNSALLDNYIKSVKKRVNQQSKEDLGKTVKELKKEIEELKSIDYVEKIETSLKSILEEPGNGIIDSSVPTSLLVTLETVRSTLQDQQDKLKDLNRKLESSTEDAQKDLKRQITQLNMAINEISEEKEELQNEKAKLEKELNHALEEKQALSKEHQSLLGKLSHIKETLTPRLEQDKQLRQRVTELTQELEITTEELERCRHDMMMREEDHTHHMERHERQIRELSTQLEHMQAEREEYEVMTNQLDAHCHQLQEELEASNAAMEQLKTKMEKEQLENESERASLANLQTVLEEFQATKDAELQAAVEYIERQLDVAKKSWAEYEERAHIAETALEKYQQDVKKTQKYEQEIKEKNLLIGKLRHEAIILNEHLVEAMRKLKEETSENNVDRQLITNLLIGFFNAPRGDRKRFDILTIIANVLQLTEEQKEQIGLVRPKHPYPLSPTSEQQPQPPQKESFTDAWISFLLKESSPLRRNRSAVSLTTPNDDSLEL